MPAYFDTGFSVRQPMWHGLGTVTDQYPSDWPEARRLAGLEWEPQLVPQLEVRCSQGHVLDRTSVEMGCCGAVTAESIPGYPTYCWDTGRDLQVLEEQRVVRSDSGLHLGSVGPNFSPVTHQQMGEVLEAILGEDTAVKFETAGSVKDGRQVWALAYLDEPEVIAGDDTPTYPYLALLNAHDGSGAMKVLPTSVRVVCWNTYRAAEMEGDRHGRTFSFRHVGKVQDRIQDAKDALAGVRGEHQAWVALASELAELPVNEAAVSNFCFQMIPEPPADVTSDRVKENIAQARASLKHLIVAEPTTDGHRGTALGLVDAGVEYLDHFRGYRSTDSYLGRTMLRPEPLKQRVVKLAREVATA